jgi:hypothetical protein
MNCFAVIQTRFEHINPEVLREAFVSQAGMPHADASQAAHRDRGILGETFSESQAHAVADRLAERGYGVDVVPADSLPSLGKPRIIHWCELGEESLRVPQGLQGDTAAISWQSIRVVNAGLIAEFEKTATPEYLPQTLSVVGPDNAAEENEPVWQKHSHYLCVVDLIALDDNGCWIYLRLPAHQLSYRRILGDCAGMQLLERFQTVLEALIERSTQAVISPDAERILRGRKRESKIATGDLRHFAEQHEFDQYDQWLLVLALRETSDRDDA